MGYSTKDLLNKKKRKELFSTEQSSGYTTADLLNRKKQQEEQKRQEPVQTEAQRNEALSFKRTPIIAKTNNSANFYNDFAKRSGNPQMITVPDNNYSRYNGARARQISKELDTAKTEKAKSKQIYQNRTATAQRIEDRSADRNSRYVDPTTIDGLQRNATKDIVKQNDMYDTKINNLKTEQYNIDRQFRLKNRDTLKGKEDYQNISYDASKKAVNDKSSGFGIDNNRLKFMYDPAYQKDILIHSTGAKKEYKDNPEFKEGTAYWRALSKATDSEKQMYAYYVGKGDEKGAQEYLDDLMPELNSRRRDTELPEVQKFYKEHPGVAVADNIINSYQSPLAMVDNAIQTAKSNITGEFSPSDPNAPAYEGANVVNDTQNILSKSAYDYAFKKTGSKTAADVASFITGTGLSVGQNLAQLPLGGAALPLMGLTAGGQSTLKTLQNGGTQEQALAFGVANTIAEIATEKLPLDNLFEIAKKAPTSAKDIIYNVLIKQPSLEVPGEMIAEITENMADIVINGDKSDYYAYANQLMDDYGLNAKEANKEAFLQYFVKNTLSAGAGGYLAGMMLGGGASAAGAVANYDTNMANKALASYKTPGTPSTMDNGIINFENNVAEDITTSPEITVNPSLKASPSTMTQNGSYAPAVSEGSNPIQNEANKPVSAFNGTSDTVAKLNEISKPFSEMGRRAFQSSYDGNDMPSYFGGFAKYYEAGKNGKAMDSVTDNALSNTQKYAAYSAGQNDMTLASKKSGFVENEYSRNMDTKLKKSLDDLGLATNKKIVVTSDTGKFGYNGMIDGDTIYIARDSQNHVLDVAKHEITHHMAKVSPNQYRRYRDYVLKSYAKNGEDVEAKIAKRQEEYIKSGVKLSYDGAAEELVADFTKSIMTGEKSFSDLVNTNRNAAQVFVDSVRRFIRMVKAKTTNKWENAISVDDIGINLRQLEKSERLWTKALKASTQTKSAATAKANSMKNNTVNKEKQLSIIKQNNPADDNNMPGHTWIRSVDDIRTFDEAWEEWKNESGEEEFSPDYTKHDIKRAITNGKVTVYSSYPINQGTFVTPSKMEAKNYAGEGTVYSKRVNTSDVAWIDIGQGQYTGKVEPMSDVQKFHEKYSLKDSDYMNAVKAGDMKTAQKMVDEAVKSVPGILKTRNGEPLKLWHYSRTGGDFNTFNTPAWFSVNREYANTHLAGLGYRDISKDSKPFYLIANEQQMPGFTKQKMVVIPNVYGSRTIKGTALIQNYPFLSDVVDNGTTYNMNNLVGNKDIVQALVDNGYDLLTQKEEGYDVYVSLNPNHIKSAEPVTYDNSGNVIHLSERFKVDNEDIRYSLKDYTEPEAYMPVMQIRERQHPYLLADGRMTKPSRGHHDAAFEALNRNTKNPIPDFMSYGNVRITGENDRIGVEMLTRPTSEQMKSIETIAGERPIYYDFTDKDGKIVKGGTAQDYNAFKRIVDAYNNYLPIKRYSLKDNLGNTLSPKQVEFFKDSNVRDDNGNLLVVYHGTKGASFDIVDGKIQWKTPFNTFDVGKNIEPGAWFSPNKNTAGMYGTAVPFYLNVTNPIRNENPLETAPENNDGIYRTNSTYNDIQHADEIAAFSPNQIKSIDNKNPTENDDINLSLKGDYTELIKKHGAIEEGENPARKIQVPNRTKPGNKVRKFTRTAMEAEVTPDYMIDEFEKEIINGTFSYEPLKDQKANDYAEVQMGNSETAEAIWKGVVEGNRVASKEQIVLGEKLYLKAANEGDYKKAMRLAAEIAAEGTRAGQNVQALRLLKKMTGEGQLYYVKKTVDKLQDDLDKSKGKRASKQITDMRKEVKRLEREIEKSENYVDNAEETVELIKQLQAHLDRKESAQEKLDDIVSQRKAIVDRLNKLRSEIGRTERKEYSEWWNAQLLARELGTAQDKLKTAKEELKKTSSLKKQISDLKRKLSIYGDLQIPEELAAALAGALTQDEINTAVDAILTNVAEQMPATFLDKWNAWRYLSMLGNPRTHIRNLFGNAIFVPAVELKNAIAASLESAVDANYHRFTGKNITRTKSLKGTLPFSGKEYAELVNALYEQDKTLMTQGGKMNPSDIITDRRRIFKNSVLEWARKKNFDLMEKEDNIFLKHHYKRALTQYLMANKVDITTIDAATKDGNELLTKASEYAINEAKKATYRDTSEMASLINKWSRQNKVANVFIEGVLPFKKTPINILKRGLEYSPAGLLETITRQSVKLKRGDITVNEYLDRMASGMSGTMIMALGAFLASLGVLAGGIGDEDKDKFKVLQGEQKYALKFGNKSYTVDWMAPISLPLFVGAEMMKAIGREKELTFAEVGNSLALITEPMFNLSMLNGLNNTINSVKYDMSGKALSTIAGATISSYFGQAVPTVSGQAARIVDPVRRTTYIDKNSKNMKLVDSFIQMQMKKIPGVSKLAQPYIDEWGRTNEGGGVAERVTQNLASPGYFGKTNTSAMEQALEKIGDNKVFPNKAAKSFSYKVKSGKGTDNRFAKDKVVDVEMTGKQYAEFAKEKGQTSYDMLKDVVMTDMFNQLEDEDKIRAVTDVYSYANAKAKMKVSDYKPGGWIAKAMAGEKDYDLDPKDYILYRIAQDMYSEDGNASTNQKEAERAIDSLDIDLLQKSYLWQSTNSSWKSKNNPY